MSNSLFQPTGVNPQGLTALIRNLGRDCPPTQYLREFLKNSIEACERTGEDLGLIRLDFNEIIFQEGGFYKLAFTDNGDGMAPEQMLSLLNSLSSSGGVANQHQNYGVGAKISALTRNHAGIQYESWKDGKGYCVFICYQAESDVYGVQGFVTGTGEPVYARPISDDDKPDMIGDHGTRVTLMGMNPTQDTMHPPHGVPGTREQWITNYLNTRFFTLPASTEITARVGYCHPLENPEQNHLQVITGYQEIANHHCHEYGQLRLADATAYWWILPEDCAIQGHTALINQGEIFDISDSRSQRLSHFGIVVGRNRIILMIEPDEAVQNTARTNLIKPDGSGLNWNAWQDEFRANMPGPIRNFIDSLLNSRSRVAHSNHILQRLRKLFFLYRLSGYKGLKDPATVIAENKPPEPAQDPSESHDPLPPAEETPPAEEEHDLSFFPKVQWTNEAQSPQLTGRAAEYVALSNLILANRDFKGFQDLMTYFTQRYADTEQYPELVIDVVMEASEQALMECVAGVLSMEGQPNWHAHHIHLALTPEALSTAVMQRYWVSGYIDQAIREKLQKIS